jgi:hypothetical protein
MRSCLITAYSLSAMAVDGVRFGEVQLMATGVLLSVAGIAFTCDAVLLLAA